LRVFARCRIFPANDLGAYFKFICCQSWFKTWDLAELDRRLPKQLNSKTRKLQQTNITVLFLLTSASKRLGCSHPI
jgi:hypothetical protein